jgi:hypothetical protein
VDNLRVLPNHTGGRTVVNTNDPDEHLPDIFAESQSYYLLGFEPTTVATDGEVHEIEVKVNRRGTNVRTRSGYAVYPPKADAVNAEFADLADVVATLDRPLPSADIPLTTAVAAFAVPGSREAAVAVVVGADLPMRAAPRRVSLVAAAFDRRGRSAGVQRQTIELPLSPSAYVDEGLIARLNLAPGRYDVRVAVKDEASGAIGSVFTFVDVPAFAEAAVSISGLLIREPDAPAMPDNPMADLFAFVPTVRRAFGPNEQASVFARVYQHAGVPAPVTVTTRVVDVRDQQVFAASQELPASAFGATGADYAIELPLSTLTPGDYLLTVTAGDAAHGARGEVRFTALLAEDTRSLNSGCSNTGSPDTRSPDSGCP